jgi:hypothetical protein
MKMTDTAPYVGQTHSKAPCKPSTAPPQHTVLVWIWPEQSGLSEQMSYLAELFSQFYQTTLWSSLISHTWMTVSRHTDENKCSCSSIPQTPSLMSCSAYFQPMAGDLWMLKLP